MKKFIFLLTFVLACAFVLPVYAGKTADKPGKGNACVSIQDGLLTYSAGHYFEGDPLILGFDPYGYNYQGHMFNGTYANVYLGRGGFPPYEGDDDAYAQKLSDEGYTTNPYKTWYWPYRSTRITMKWNDAWLANTDCGTQDSAGVYIDDEPDGILDRHYGFDTYIGSGAWETNHMFDEYVGKDDKTCKWNDFVKIVAVPTDAYRVGPANTGIWYTADGDEIGTDIWGEFALIHEVYNDPCEGYHGVYYKNEAPTGFGYWMP